MKTFRERLERARKAGAMTPADLSVWFDRPYATVRSWLYDDREPWGPAGEIAYDNLAALEVAIEARNGFPVPIELSPGKRRDHVANVRRYLRLPRSRSAA